MLAGDDPESPVYWYAIGDVFSGSRGERELIIEGVNVAKVIKLSRTKVLQLSRKVFVFRDIDTNEVTTECKGRKTPAIKYEYQAVTYSLHDGSLVSELTMGKGDSIVTLRGDRFYWRDIGDEFVICSPLFTERGWVENYDFYGGTNSGYRLSWYGVGPSSIVETGQVVMAMSGIRLTRFEDIPEGLRNFIVKEAPLWQFPPRDMDEIARLQKIVPSALG